MSLQPGLATCIICGRLPGTQGLLLAQFQPDGVTAAGLRQMGTVHRVPKAIPRSVSCWAPWKGGSLTFKPVHGTADTDWISILKHVILTLIREHNVLSAHDGFTVSCISHTRTAPRAAAGATSALSEA